MEYLSLTVGYHENTFYIEMYLNPMTKCIMYSLNQTLIVILIVIQHSPRAMLPDFCLDTMDSGFDLLALNVLIYMMKHMATPTTPP